MCVVCSVGAWGVVNSDIMGVGWEGDGYVDNNFRVRL